MPASDVRGQADYSAVSTAGLAQLQLSRLQAPQGTSQSLPSANKPGILGLAQKPTSPVVRCAKGAGKARSRCCWGRESPRRRSPRSWMSPRAHCIRSSSHVASKTTNDGRVSVRPGPPDGSNQRGATGGGVTGPRLAATISASASLSRASAAFRRARASPTAASAARSAVRASVRPCSSSSTSLRSI